jgi:hypothetical protein
LYSAQSRRSFPQRNSKIQLVLFAFVLTKSYLCGDYGTKTTEIFYPTVEDAEFLNGSQGTVYHPEHALAPDSAAGE